MSHGRNKKSDIKAIILNQYNVEVNVSHSVEFDSTTDELFEIGKGRKTNKHIGKGGFGIVKLTMKLKKDFDHNNPYKESWFAAKTPAKDKKEEEWK